VESSVNRLLRDIPKIRIIPYAEYIGRFNMAADVFFAESYFQIPVIRFYGWKPWCLSLGVHQKDNVVDRDALKSAGIDLVRRPTGGRAVFHARELTYSVIFSKKVTTHKDLYRYIHEIIAVALKGLGFPVELTGGNMRIPQLNQGAEDFPCFSYSAESEIQYRGKKIVGSAQRIYPESILQHGSILFEEEHSRLPEFLKTSKTVKDQISSEIIDKTVSLAQIAEINQSPSDVAQVISAQFQEDSSRQVMVQNFTRQELGQIQFTENSFII
jgi:lipoate-protein ligase A